MNHSLVFKTKKWKILKYRAIYSKENQATHIVSMKSMMGLSCVSSSGSWWGCRFGCKWGDLLILARVASKGTDLIFIWCPVLWLLTWEKLERVKLSNGIVVVKIPSIVDIVVFRVNLEFKLSFSVLGLCDFSPGNVPIVMEIVERTIKNIERTATI